MPKRLFIIIGCDVDPDRESFVGKIPANTLTWRGMLEGITRGKSRLSQLLDSDGKPPVFSWALRVDHQVARLSGSYQAILETNKGFLLGLQHSGDELCWHPHFWRYDDRIGQWYQEFWDEDFHVSMLKEAHAAFRSVFPGLPTTVRTGWSFHSNLTFAILEELGIQVEHVCIPGLKVLPKNDTVRSSNFYDWSISPDHPYYPARADYRREAQPGENAFKILVVPTMVSRSFFWGMGSAIQLTRKMKDPSQLMHPFQRPTHVINVTGKVNWYAPVLKRAEKLLASQDTLIYNCYLHADELIENQHPFYSLENMEINLQRIVDMGKRAGAQVKFIRACDVKQYV